MIVKMAGIIRRLGRLAGKHTVAADDIDTNAVTEPKMADAAVNRASLKTLTYSSLAGSVPAGTQINLGMSGYCFFPHITGEGGDFWLRTHSVDVSDPDLPRFAIKNDSGGTRTYAIDYRYVEA